MTNFWNQRFGNTSICSLVAVLDDRQRFHIARYRGFTSGLSVLNVYDSISFLASSELHSSRPAHSISCPNTSPEVDGGGEVAKRETKKERNAKHRLSQTKLLTAFSLLEPPSTLIGCAGGWMLSPWGERSPRENLSVMSKSLPKPSISRRILASLHSGDRKTLCHGAERVVRDI